MSQRDKMLVSPTDDTAIGSPRSIESDRSVGEELVHNRVHEKLFGSQSGATKVGRFALLERLGEGAMGAVYAAYDETLDRKVAIKLLHHHSAEADARLLKEARSLARVVHPSVVAVHEVGDDPGGLYLAMEFVRGFDLSEWMSETHTWRECLDVFVQAGRGLAAAHAAGVTHRDFKPANVLLSEDGRVRVVDFGLASAPGRAAATEPSETDSQTTTESGRVMGTPAYMASECWEGGAIDARSDQFAFCVSLFEAIHGARPYVAPTVPKLAAEVKGERLTAPPHPDRAPRWLAAALTRGLRRDPDERWPSMAALLDELDQQRRPRGSWWPLAVATAAVGASGIAAVVALTAQSADEPCLGGKEQVEQTWTAPQHAAIATAFTTVEPAFGRQAWDSIRPTLDRYAATWESQYTALCEATHVRGELSRNKLDVRMRCLQRRWRRFETLVDVFRDADADVVRRAALAVESLPEPAECADIDGKANTVSLPPEQDRATVQQLRLELEEAHAMVDAGRYDAAIERAGEALDAARATDYEPLVAEATWQLAVAQERRGDRKEAAEGLSQAFYMAHAVRDDRLATTVARSLVYVRGREPGGLDAALRWGQLARAGLRRTEATDLDWSDLWAALGSAYVGAGQLDAALGYAERAVEAQRKGDQPLQLAVTLNNLGIALHQVGRTEAAVTALREAAALRAKHQGASHPQALETLNALAVSLGEAGETEEANAVIAKVLRTYEESYGPEDLRVAKVLNNQGITHNNAGRHEEAIAAHTRALEIRESKLGPSGLMVAYSLVNLAIAERRLGRLDDAIGHSERAQSIFIASVGPDDQRLATVGRNLGSLYGDIGEREKAAIAYSDAIGVLERASSSSATLASIRTDLAGILSQLGRHEEALVHNDLAKTQLLALDPVPNDALVPILSGRAETLLALGKVEAAKTDATRAVELATDDQPRRKGDALRVLARVQHAAGASDDVIAGLVAPAAPVYRAGPPHTQPQAAAIRPWGRRVSHP
ncbi:MAG: serine/threonine-protein kinase, partial [Myxococcota bacterium]